MTPEEIQRLSNEQLLNKLMTIGHEFLTVTDNVKATDWFYLMKDLKHEALFRMRQGRA